MEERLQKILAHAGFGSRRACETLITEGRVRVNGQAVSLGDKADPATDLITVDGKSIQPAEELVYVALYKPRGVISAAESPDPRPTVRDLVPVAGRLYPVGRLDVDSEGLILLTNDGDLANRLTHPRYEHEKEYRVLVARQPDKDQLQAWQHGIVLEDGYKTRAAQVNLIEPFGKGAWLQVILKEGRKRQIREMGAKTGLPVVRIIRTRIGSLRLGGLKPRQWRLLTRPEILELKGEQAKPLTKPKGGAGKGMPSRARPITSQDRAGRKPPGAGRRPSSGRGQTRDKAGPPVDRRRPGPPRGTPETKKRR